MQVKIVATNIYIMWVDKIGNVHNETGPAFRNVFGSVSYHIHGTCHRTDGPAAIDLVTGSKLWYNHDKIVKRT